MQGAMCEEKGDFLSTGGRYSAAIGKYLKAVHSVLTTLGTTANAPKPAIPCPSYYLYLDIEKHALFSSRYTWSELLGMTALAPRRLGDFPNLTPEGRANSRQDVRTSSSGSQSRWQDLNFKFKVFGRSSHSPKKTRLDPKVVGDIDLGFGTRVSISVGVSVKSERIERYVVSHPSEFVYQVRRTDFPSSFGALIAFRTALLDDKMYVFGEEAHGRPLGSNILVVLNLFTSTWEQLTEMFQQSPI
ncbi:hypothetical protein F5877DRAFT_68979 [Lentinula edodes]|nr:hypothetical protein F5877DRAFT_68979 [Lentinula edodes]